MNVMFTSNGYLIDDELISFFVQNKINCRFQITLDGGRDEHDRVRFITKTKGSYDKILENIKSLIDNEIFVTLRVNYTDLNLASTSQIANEFLEMDKELLDKYLVVDYHRVWQNSKIDNLNILLSSIMDAYRKNNIKVEGSYNHNSVINACYADKRNSVVINYNGDLYKCTARDFTKKNRVGYLSEEGNLVWENNHLNKRMNVKFNNKPCLECRLLPLCNGGCTQRALDNINNSQGYCIYSFNEDEKDKVIKYKVDELIRNI